MSTLMDATQKEEPKQDGSCRSNEQAESGGLQVLEVYADGDLRREDMWVHAVKAEPGSIAAIPRAMACGDLIMGAQVHLATSAVLLLVANCRFRALRRANRYQLLPDVQSRAGVVPDRRVPLRQCVVDEPEIGHTGISSAKPAKGIPAVSKSFQRLRIPVLHAKGSQHDRRKQRNNEDEAAEHVGAMAPGASRADKRLCTCSALHL
mmetsp:Transcript_34117/g.86308  ORF Transcript_34117/g.86308 Transcript_34117/m.86308 type:complete len:206 (-) Transcript_34117:84-701(-)